MRNLSAATSMLSPPTTNSPLSYALASEDCQRHAVMTAFESFQEFTENFDELMELFYESPPISPYETENRYEYAYAR